MNAPVRRLAIACLLLFLALLVNANYLQVVDAHKLRTDPYNARELLTSYDRQRGPIVAGKREIARSVRTNDRLKYLRTYPGGPEYAHVTGYYSFVLGGKDIELSENELLAGIDDRLFGSDRLSDLVTGRRPQGGAVVLTIDPAVQNAAWRGLQGKIGAAVALDPRTGKILAMASTPSYDPSLLTSHDGARIQRNWKRLLADPGQPLLDRAIARTYPPGSLFKVVTSTAALSNGYAPDTVIPAPLRYRLPQSTHELENFGGESCGASGKATLTKALEISCNTAFAQLGVALGADKLAETAHAFGIGRDDVKVPMTVAPSVFPDQLDPPQTALAAIGQYDVRLTPLQAAMIASAVANHGVLMQPYLVDHTLAPDLSVLDRPPPQPLGEPMSAAVAGELTEMMRQVVAHGTGTAAQIPGVAVAGKTGTAQHAAGQPPHAWFIAFAPADAPRVAVAVLVENGGGLGSDATGGRVAAPIAKSMIEAVLGR
ncbi:MAG: peptidoglycan D,D-transpeptidase FtsI family protein [Frankiaceae bacterium]